MDVQFYPTPQPLVARAWSKFRNTDFVRVLEPSAGEAHLAKGRPNHDSYGGYSNRPPPLDCIELDVTKHAHLRESGFDVIGIDFMQFDGAGAIYSHVIMNPPYRMDQAASNFLDFFGLPPSFPFLRAASALAALEDAPPSLPISAAIQRFEPRKPSRSAGM